MAESTLAMTYAELLAEIGYFLWSNRSPGAAQTTQAQSIIKRGLRRFYYPPAIPDPKVRGKMITHQWSFLEIEDTQYVWPDVAVDATVTVTGVTSTVTASEASFYETMIGQSIVITGVGTFPITGYTSSTVITVTGDATGTDKTFSIAAPTNFRLPVDFGYLVDDKIHFAADLQYASPTKIAPARITEMRAEYDYTMYPQWFAIQARASDLSVGQRYELMMHPQPDAAYAMTFRFHVQTNTLTKTTYEYPLGSAMHAETILASCLAIAEMTSPDHKDGDNNRHFLECLQQSVITDQAADGVHTFGYNGDASSEWPSNAFRRGVTYKDVQY